MRASLAWKYRIKQKNAGKDDSGEVVELPRMLFGTTTDETLIHAFRLIVNPRVLTEYRFSLQKTSNCASKVAWERVCCLKVYVGAGSDCLSV